MDTSPATARIDRQHRRLSVLLTVIPLLVYLLALAAFVQDRYSLFQFPLDDAWIHRVYASSFWHGHGFAYNAGQQEAGSSSPFWSILTSPAELLADTSGHNVAVAVKLIGVLLGLAAVRATAILTACATGSALAGCLAATLFAWEPRLLFSALSGMENTLLLALWTWVCVALCKRRLVLALALLGLMPVTRPEALVLLPLAALPACALLRQRGWSLTTASALLLPVVPLVLWLSFCHVVTGHWLPNTYYVKAGGVHQLASDLDLAWLLLVQHGYASLWLFSLGFTAFLLPLFTARLWERVCLALCLLVAPCVYLLGVVATRLFCLGGYYWTRWADPATLLLTLPFCIGCACLCTWIAKRDEHVAGLVPVDLRPFRRVVGGFMLLALAASMPFFWRSFTERSKRLATDSRAIAIMNVGLGTWLRDNTPTNAVVAVNDAGATRYFGRRRTLDLMGLNNAAIAFHHAEPSALLQQADWVAIFPAWFKGSDLLRLVQQDFAPCHEILIPLEEYTVAYAPDQIWEVVYRRKTQP